MRKNILRHLTVTGFVQKTDLSKFEILEAELNEAKGKYKLARKDLKVAKQKLNQALEEAIIKIETKKKEIEETPNNLVDN